MESAEERALGRRIAALQEVVRRVDLGWDAGLAVRLETHRLGDRRRAVRRAREDAVRAACADRVAS
jgi:hypothetical protein